MQKNVKLMAEIAVAVALSTVLSYLTLFRMPQGGSINLEMLPILFIAFRWGGVPGLLLESYTDWYRLSPEPMSFTPLNFCWIIL